MTFELEGTARFEYDSDFWKELSKTKKISLLVPFVTKFPRLHGRISWGIQGGSKTRILNPVVGQNPGGY